MYNYCIKKEFKLVIHKLRHKKKFEQFKNILNQNHYFIECGAIYQK